MLLFSDKMYIYSKFIDGNYASHVNMIGIDVSRIIVMNLCISILFIEYAKFVLFQVIAIQHSTGTCVGQ